MGQTVKLRRSAVSGRVPINSQLQLGELSVNTADGKLFFAKSGSLGPSIEEIITTNTQNTGSIDLVGALTASVVSSSFIGDGRGLYNIPASGVTGLSLDKITSGPATASISETRFDVNVDTVIDGSLTVTEITGSGLGLTNVPVNISGSSHLSTNYDSSFTKLHFDHSTGIKIVGDTSTGIAKIYLDGVASENESGVGNTKLLTVTTASSTWTFNHGLGEKYPSIVVFDGNDNVIIPQNIEAVSESQLVVSFASPQIGYVTATVGGGLPSYETGDYKTLVTENGVPTWKEGILSGSISFDSYSSSIDDELGVRDLRLNSIESLTGSYLIESDLDGLDDRIDSLEVESGSIRTDLNTYTSSTDNRLDSLEVTSGSQKQKLGEHRDRLVSLEVTSGSHDNRLDSLEVTSGSHDGRLDSIESKTGSFLVSNDLSTIEGKIGSLETTSGSHDGRLDSLETESGSIRSTVNTYTSSNDIRVDNLESFETTVGGGLEFTGSNVTIKGDLLVKGTETRVDSTTVEVSDNIISLNGSGAANGGIEVRDVTSPGILSGSLIWDGTDNKWKAGVKGSEDSIVLVGDLNSFTSSNDDRLDRIETSTSSLNSFTSSISTTIKDKLNNDGVISGSVQIDHDATTNYVGNEHIDHSTITIGSGKGLTGGGTIDTSRSLTLDTGSAHFLDGVKSKLNTETVVSGSEQIDITGTTNYNLVDGRLDSLESNSGSYLTEFTETDPIFTASPSAGITETNITNWDSAYTYSTVGHLPLSGGTITGDVRFLDDDQLKLGSGNDLRLWHNGTNSYLFNYGGSMFIGTRTNDTTFLGNDGNNGDVTYFKIDGSNQGLYYYKSQFFADGVKSHYGASNDLEIYHDGSNSYITEKGTGNLNIKGGQGLALLSSSDEFYFYGDTNGQVNLYHNGLKKFETTSGGIEVSGTIVATGYNDSNWNTAYGWGDHSQVGYITGFTNTNEFTTGATFNSGDGVITFTRNNGGDTFTVDLDGRYLTSFTETDPIFMASPSAGITDTNISNWNTAYGWGDHSQAGYTGDQDLSGYLLNTTDAFSGNLTFNGGNNNSKESFINVKRGSGAGLWLKFQTDSTSTNNVSQFVIRRSTDNVDILSISATSGNLTVPGTLSASGYNNTNWDTAYGWGDHSQVGYITGFTNTNEFTTGATFNSSDGKITFTRNNGGDTYIVDIDGRFSLTSHNHDGDYIQDGGTTSVGNINTIGTESIKHRWNNSTIGRPASSQSNEYGTVTTLTYDSLYATQIAWDIHDNNLYGRTLDLTNDTGTWSKFFTDTNFTDNSTNWNTAYGWGDHSQEGYLKSYNDEYTTGATFNGGNGIITFTRNDGDQYTVDISSTLTDVTVTGGTYNDGTQTLTLTKSDGDTVDVTGFAIESVKFTTGATFNDSNGIITFTNNDNTTYTVDIDDRYLQLGGGTLTGNLTLNSTNPEILFNGTSDAGVDMAIKATPEGLNFYEPEDSNKIHFQILDDAGVNSTYGYKVGNTVVINSSRVLSNVTGNISMFTNDSNYLTSFTETDPIFTASPSAGITDTNISNWNTAYGWGDHSTEGYLKSFTETDPIYTSERNSLRLNKMVQSTLLFSVLEDYNKPSGYSTMIQPSSYQNPLPSHGYYHILGRRDGGGGYGALLQSYNSDELFHGNTTSNTTNIVWRKIWTDTNFTQSEINNWGTAYGWGDHASAGYITGYSETDTLDSVTDRGATTTNNITVGNILSTDQVKVTSTGTATLILRGDSGNSGDTGQLDSTIKMLHDDESHGIHLETRNYAGKNSFEILSIAAGTPSSRFLIDQDGDGIFTGNVQMQTGNSVGKFAVMSTGVHGSYDFYNNGTSYFNNSVTIDGNLTLSGNVDILMDDNSGAAVEFKQGSDLYMRFITTNGGEHIEVNKNIELQGVTATSGQFSSTLSVASDIIHSGDSDTKISFTDNNVKIIAGNKNYLHAHDNGSLFLYGGNGTALTLDTQQFATFATRVGIGVSASTNAMLDVRGPDTDNAVLGRFWSNTGSRGSFIIRNGTNVSPTTFIGTAGGSEQLSIGTNNIEAIRLDASQNTRFTGGVIIEGGADRITAEGSSMYLGGGNGNTTLIQFSGKAIPDSDKSHDLGSTNRYWRNAYIDVITATGGNSTNWNTAYGWGDHSTEGYITGFTDTNEFVTGATFNTGDGKITFTRNNGGDTFNVDIDGRFSLTSHNHDGVYFKFDSENAGFLNLQQNTVGTTFGNGVATVPSYYFGQKVGDNDGWRLYGEAPSSNDVKMIFEIIDDIESGDTWVFRNKKTYDPYTANDVVKIQGNGNIITLGTITASGYNSSNWDTAYGWGDHSQEGYVTGDYLPIAGGTLTGNLIVGSVSKTSDSVVKVLADQGYKAGFEAYGNGQGTGYIYLGQSTSHGGGMSYNGDGSPALVSGESADRITFYRRTNSVDSEVFSYNHNSDSVYFNGEILPSTINTGQGSTEVHLMNQNIRTTDDVQFGKGKFSEQVSVNNRTAMSVAHWSRSGNTTGAIKIKIPGTHTSNWSMLVLRITTYEYNSNAHAVYYVSGHDWTSGWYNNGVTVQGTGKLMSLGFSTAENEDYVILGDTDSTWAYGHVTVDVVAHPDFYNSSMDITSGWVITQETALDGITINSVTNKQLLDTSTFGTKISQWDTAYGWGNHADQDYATETYVGDQIDTLIDSAPGTLDTLNELAEALGDDPNFATTITNSIATKLPLSGGTLTGDLIIQHTDDAPGELLHLRNDSNGNGATIKFSDQATTAAQYGSLSYYHANGASYGSEHAFVFDGTEAGMSFVVKGKVMYSQGIYTTPSTGTGAGTRKDTNWDTAYGWGDHSQAGYTSNTGTLTDSNDRNYITDSRGAVRAPSYYNDRYAQWDFQNKSDTTVGGDEWHALLTVSKWTGYSSTHRQEQLIFSGDHLWRRTATSDSVWGTNKKIWDSGNLTNNSGNWDTAYGWGDHSVAGYTGDQDLSGYLLNSTDTFVGSLSINGDIRGTGQQLILNAGESYSVATAQTNEYVYVNAEQGLEVNSDTGNWSGGWAARKTALLRGDLLRLDGEDLTKTNIQNFKTAYGWGDHDGVYLPIAGKAADSEKLDGIDSSEFLRSNTADTFTSTITMGTQKALVANNYGRGVYGLYSATRYQHVWSMGTAYNLNDDGTSTGNLYGIAYTHTNIGGQSKSGLSHQALFMTNGVTKTAIGSGIWTDGTITTTSHGTSSNWKSAYDWGNHASSGYLTSSSTLNASNMTTGTLPDVFSSSTRYNIGLIDGNGSQSRDKIRVWTNSQYTIGMKSGYQFGHLGNNYAMSFQMNADADRGFWWGTDGDSDNQGAMALTTDGRANIKKSLSIGQGNTTTPSSTPLYVEGTTAGATVFEVHGTQGPLFSISDDMSGDIFEVSDISGVPILTVNASGTVTVDDTLHVKGDVIAYHSSDKRLKDNIKPILNPLDKIKLIGGYEFDWNEQSKNEGHDVGVIAQEIEEVLPELVSTRNDGYKGVKYEKITALLIEANKELLNRVEELEKKLTEK